MWTYFVHMKTATVRDLRNNFSILEAWLAEGESIRIEKRGSPVAVLSPCEGPGDGPASRVIPDFTARLQQIWGDRCFTAEEVKSMREYELEGEEG